MTQEDLDVVAQGVLDRCDAKDGLKDGIINSWEKCDFKPEMVEKKIGKKKVDLLNAIFNGAKNSKGENVYASWPYDAGINTMGWRIWKTWNFKNRNTKFNKFHDGVIKFKRLLYETCKTWNEINRI